MSAWFRDEAASYDVGGSDPTPLEISGFPNQVYHVAPASLAVFGTDLPGN